jgi:hypothetical protein
MASSSSPDPPGRGRDDRAGAALRDGLRRAAAAPAILAGSFALTLAITLPLAFVLRDMLEAHLGRSLMAGAALHGANYEWWQEFSAQATAIGTTFVPSIIGFGAVLLNLSNLLDNVPLLTAVAGVTGAWLVVWSFLSGGIIDRYARNRPTRSRGFFGACGAHVAAIARLGVIALAAYAFLFGWLHPLLLTGAYGRITHELAVERAAFAIRAALYVLFGAALMAINLVFDYARIRIVVEDRRSAIGALLAGGRFVRRNFAGAAALYLMNGGLFLALIAGYALAAPRATLPAWLALAIGETYIVGRHFLKLAFYASETSLFQARLAHASYTAGPPVEWPESPAAEAISNSTPAITP